MFVRGIEHRDSLRHNRLENGGSWAVFPVWIGKLCEYHCPQCFEKGPIFASRELIAHCSSWILNVITGPSEGFLLRFVSYILVTNIYIFVFWPEPVARDRYAARSGSMA